MPDKVRCPSYLDVLVQLHMDGRRDEEANFSLRPSLLWVDNVAQNTIGFFYH